jgi:hypothetical protein
VTIVSADTERLTAAIRRRVRAIAARFRRPAKPKGTIRVDGLLTGRVESAGVVKERLNKLDASPEHAKATQACLPIGPSCC